MYRWKYLAAILLSTCTAIHGFCQNQELSPERIQASLDKSARIAQSDPNRPVFHFLPEANWMNDPNGGFYHDGWYHIFFLQDPLNEDGLDPAGQRSNRVWGHARSKDLVFWERLPTAIFPSREAGELKPISGGSLKQDDGTVTIAYTSVPIPADGKESSLTQWIANSSPGLGYIEWEKGPSNPVLTMGSDKVPQYEDWRDPFLFDHHGNIYMIIGAQYAGRAVLPLFRKIGEDFTQWDYLGDLIDRDTSDISFFECPELYQIDEERWLLVFSPYGPVKYYIGEVNLEEPFFRVDSEGLIDHSNEHYASEIIKDDVGNLTLVGWVPGWGVYRNNGKGWNGSLSIPRALSFNNGNVLIQRPVLTMHKLRRNGVHLKRRRLKDGVSTFPQTAGDVFEVRAVFLEESATSYGLKLRVSEDGRRQVEIRKEGDMLYVMDHGIPLTDIVMGDGSLIIHAFLDKSLLEVFINEGQACITKKIYPRKDDLGFEVFSEEGTVLLKSLDVWKLKPIW